MISYFEASYAYLHAAVAPIAPPILAAALVYAIVNRKTLPFAWHTRIIYGYIRHYHLIRRQPLPRPSSLQVGGDSCPTLFQPTVYTTTVPLGEIDYSLHKSNSTYLTDLDVARGHHLYSVFRRGFTAYADGTHTTTSNDDGGGRKRGKGMLMPALGGVSCTFRREVRPYARLEIWTRVLAWDDKWIYLISHFVRPSSSSKPSKERSEGEVDPAVYATCVSKYVLKQGRKTVAPQQFLETCGFLAPLDDVASATSSSLDHQKHQGGLAVETDEEDALQKEIEKRRLKGLSLASHFAALDEGHKWFADSQEGAVLAKF